MRLSVLTVMMVGVFVVSPGYSDTSAQTVDVSVERALLPVGYDDNDRVQFAVLGKFASGCYRVGPHAYRVDVATKQIQVQQQAYLFTGQCLQIPIPFSEIITVGMVPEGNYTVVDHTSQKAIGTLAVVKASQPGPDDYLYAPLSDAYLVKNSVTQKQEMRLVGYFHDTCSRLDKVLVKYSPDAVVIQPTVKRSDTESCQPTRTRFEEAVELKEDLHGTYLFQVRAESGQAINKVLYVE